VEAERRAPQRAQLGADEPARLGVLLRDAHRGDEGATLGGEVGGRRLGGAELEPAVRAAARFADAACRVDGVEAMLGVGGERAAERLQLGDDRVGLFVGLVLNTASSRFR